MDNALLNNMTNPGLFQVRGFFINAQLQYLKSYLKKIDCVILKEVKEKQASTPLSLTI